MLTQRQQAIIRAIASDPGHEDAGISLRRLVQFTGYAINTVRKELKQLADLGWLEISFGRRRCMRYRLCDPIRKDELERYERLMLQLKNFPYRGEAILKGILDIIVAESRFTDNARPHFLINPLTGLPLEYDRYYPDWRVAIEFNGAQHDQPTEGTSNAHSVYVRDLFKEALSLRNGVTLIAFRPPELSLATVTMKLRGHLPLRRISASDPSIPLIEQYARGYRLRAAPKLKAPGQPVITSSAQASAHPVR